MFFSQLAEDHGSVLIRFHLLAVIDTTDHQILGTQWESLGGADGNLLSGSVSLHEVSSSNGPLFDGPLLWDSSWLLCLVQQMHKTIWRISEETWFAVYLMCCLLFSSLLVYVAQFTGLLSGWHGGQIRAE